MMITYVVIRDMSAGNAEAGESWQETKIFGSDATLGDVMAWGEGEDATCFGTTHSRKRITITRPAPAETDGE